MRNIRSAGPSRKYRIAGVAMGVVAVTGFFSPGAANADTFVALPDGHSEGQGATINSVGEHVTVSPSLASNGAGRNAWVSGRVTADVVTPHGTAGPNNGPQNSPGTNDSSTHGVSALTVGYEVGCQVALASSSPGLSASLSSAPSISASASLPLSLSPGEVKWVRFDQIDIPDSGTYHLDYDDQEISIQGCGGYAQARQFAVVEIVGADYSKTTLYGQPFSIG